MIVGNSIQSVSYDADSHLRFFPDIMGRKLHEFYSLALIVLVVPDRILC